MVDAEVFAVGSAVAREQLLERTGEDVRVIVAEEHLGEAQSLWTLLTPRLTWGTQGSQAARPTAAASKGCSLGFVVTAGGTQSKQPR